MNTESISWQDRLDEVHPGREDAIVELRLLLVKGLRAGLSGRAAADEGFLEDIAQVSLIRILEHLHTFQGRSKFSSWALSIALRAAYNELRRKEWKAVSLEQLKDEHQEESTDQSPGPDTQAARRNMADLLRQVIITELTDKQRDVLLCELSGMPQEEIARQLNSSRNAIYKLFHDSRKALKRALEARGFGQAEIADIYADKPENGTT